MHKSSYLRMEYLLKWYQPYWDKKDRIRVLDIGSYNQNGTYKDLFNKDKFNYCGLDMIAGPNVDIVPQDIYSWKEIEDNTYDIVISGQVFEHIEFPWLTMKEIERILIPGGVCFITAPNAGHEHKAPLDCYRYYSDGLASLAKWANLYVHHTSVAGIPHIDCADEWIDEWNDAFLVAQKTPIEKVNLEEPFRYEARKGMDGKVHLQYKNFHIAVQDIKRKVNNSKPFILFGAGILAEELLDLFGEDCVYGFGDNSTSKIGKEIRGKKIFSLEYIKEIKDNFNIVISTYSNVAYDIKKQLLNEGIEAHILYLEEK